VLGNRDQQRVEEMPSVLAQHPAGDQQKKNSVKPIRPVRSRPRSRPRISIFAASAVHDDVVARRASHPANHTADRGKLPSGEARMCDLLPQCHSAS